MNYSITQYLLLGAVALVYVGVITGPMRKIAIRYNAVDAPDMARKIQKEPVPYLGGVAIVVGVVITSYIALVAKDFSVKSLGLASSVLVPAILIAAMGLWDDLRGLQPWPRLIAQPSVGTAMALILIATDTMGFALGNQFLNAAISIFWIVGITNSINFFDNLDGGAAGAIAATSFGLFLIAYNNGQYLISATSITIFAAMLGFLIWNKSPAKIYMGDAGALFLGAVIAVLTIRLDPEVQSKTISFAIPLLLLAVPILDTSVAVTSRIRRRRSIFQGGHDHLSHRLMRKGFTKRQSAYALWSLAAIFAGIATTIATTNTDTKFLVLMSGLFWLGLFVTFLKSPDQ